MSNIITESFGTYGVGDAGTATGPVALAMLSGVWAAPPQLSTFGYNISQLPWSPTDQDLYLSGGFGGISANDPTGWRRVLPAEQATTYMSLYFGCSQLPTNTPAKVISFRNSGNVAMATLCLETTGGLTLRTGNAVGNAILAATGGPVIRAETVSHIELKFVPASAGSGAFVVYVDDVEVINAATISVTSPGPLAQFNLFDGVAGTNPGASYISHLIVRDVNGDANNTFPIGDRKVATLMVNADDVDHQGWEPHPLHCFGTGILKTNTAGSYVRGPAAVSTDLGALDFTLEGEFRFDTLPTGGNKAVLFSKWNEAGNQRSYEFYLGGPTLESGLLVFRTSTNGAAGTVVEKAKWDWKPVTGTYYHIAMCRDGGSLKLFIDGVEQGTPVVDGDTYFAGTAFPALGAETTTGGAGVAGTYFAGWQDEWRMTVGLSRYSTSFDPPTDGFPRGVDDPHWADVKWLSSWNDASVADDGPLSLALVAVGGAAAITPNDGFAGFQTINQATPFDATFIAADLLPATGLFTLTAVPSPSETVTVGTKDGTAPAVYKFVAALAAAFDVLIGVDFPTTMANLVAAVNAGAGAGTVYGAGTTANADVSAAINPSSQMEVEALVSGTGGNAIVSTTTAADGSWSAATLTGGVDIPPYSQFRLSHLPNGVTIVDSVTIDARAWKTDAGPGTLALSFVGPDGGVLSGASAPISVTPTVYSALFEEDPDTLSTLTPTSILNGLVRIDRTA